MRFLVDAQLPPALAQFLRESGHQAEHVLDIELMKADDKVIWDEAAKKKAVLVTKDEDFQLRLVRDPKISVVWIRIGNCSNRVLLQKLNPLLAGIVERLQQGERLIEII